MHVALFHHAHGLTDGVAAFADRLREAGHTVHTPDMYEGQTFDDLEAGVGYAQETGFDVIAERGVAAVQDLPGSLVYVGFSLGVVPAQRLAQTRPGARGAVLCYSALPPEMFGEWPEGMPAQIHYMDGDEWAQEDIEAIEEIGAADGAEVFVYPGTAHLFGDSSLPDHDPAAAALMMERILGLLQSIDAAD
jgi:dienelactone hydrolase